MRTITVTGDETIQIGRRGENQAIQIVWKNILENWRTMYGEGVVQLAVRRPKDTAPYPVACEVIGNDVMWTIQAADTAQNGEGECELSYIVGAVLVKSQTWDTMIARSLTGGGTVEPPREPAKTWFAEIKTEIGNLEDLETDDKSNLVAAINAVAQSGADGITPHIGDNGNWYIGSTDTGKPSRGVAGAKGSDGANGKDGAQGKKGADGVTPHIGDNGNWYIGENDTGKPSRGATGAKGDAGATGKTPVRGTDYWTAADKQEIVNSVIAALPDGTEVSY